MKGPKPMSMTLGGHERKRLAGTNVGLRLLFDSRQTRSSATIFLQWCVAKPIAEYFRDKQIRNLMLLIEVKRPDGREARHLFALTSENEVMQFHVPGTHTIRARIVWGAKLKVMRNALLGKYNGRYFAFDQFLGRRSKKREHAIGLKCFGEAELPIEVPAKFFAPQLSALETWWINLLFPTDAQNSCSIRRRRIIAYVPIFQPLLVLIWHIVLVGTWRSLNAFFFGVLCGFRVDLRPIVHPFTQSVFDMWANNTSWINRRVDGAERVWGDAGFLFTPLIHVILSAISLLILLGNGSPITWANFGIVYGMVIVCIVVMCLFIWAIVGVSQNLGTWWENALAKLSAWLMPDKWERLLCSKAPMQGLRPIGYTPRLLYQRAVGKYCKPVVA